MHNHIRCSHLNNLILETLENCGVLSNEQLAELIYSNSDNKNYLIWRKMKKLFDSNKVKRDRLSFAEPYHYYLDKKLGQIKHRIGLNWMYIYAIKSLKSWEQLYNFDYEKKYEILRTDAFYGIKNTHRKEKQYEFTFVEMDYTPNNNFNKIKLYNELYEAKSLYSNKWWFNYAHRFPDIKIVTVDYNRYKSIKNKIETENRNGLRFSMYLLEDLINDCKGEIKKLGVN